MQTGVNAEAFLKSNCKPKTIPTKHQTDFVYNEF